VIRLAVRVPREQAEVVLAELLELAPAGVEEVELGPGLVEYAVYGAPGELPGLPDLKAAAGAALIEISTSEIADDWQERWRGFHRPILIRARAANSADVAVPDLYVRPPWEPVAEASAAVEEIVIDPGQAFGTGAHATTRLCLELLLELAGAQRARGPVIDLGTGSGVLAIAAARLGFGPVLAFDHEAASVSAAAANAAANGVELAARQIDLRTQSLPPLGEGVVVLANLLFPLLLGLSRTISEAPGQLVVSGLLREQADELVEAFVRRFGLREQRRLCRGEWAASWLASPGSASIA
jgi:ribosomal protein L11 methyltransferase